MVTHTGKTCALGAFKACHCGKIALKKQTQCFFSPRAVCVKGIFINRVMDTPGLWQVSLPVHWWPRDRDNLGGNPPPFWLSITSPTERRSPSCLKCNEQACRQNINPAPISQDFISPSHGLRICRKELYCKPGIKEQQCCGWGQPKSSRSLPFPLAWEAVLAANLRARCLPSGFTCLFIHDRWAAAFLGTS